MKLRHVVGALALTLSTTLSHAGTIHQFALWDENDIESVSEEMGFVDGDVSLTVSAWTASFNTQQQQGEDWSKVTGNDVGVYQDYWGLGVISSPGDGNDLDGGSSGDYADDPDEGLLLVFSRRVDVLDIFVGDLDGNDDINFSVVDLTNPDAPVLGNSEVDFYGPDFQVEWAFGLGPQFTGSAFMLWVDGDSDDVELLGVTVKKVPTPATLLLFMAGLTGLVIRRRK